MGFAFAAIAQGHNHQDAVGAHVDGAGACRVRPGACAHNDPALDAIALQLDAATEGIDGTGASAPGAVDAGEMSVFVLGMLETVTTGLVGIGVSVATQAEQVRSVAADMRATDAREAIRFAKMTGGM